MLATGGEAGPHGPEGGEIASGTSRIADDSRSHPLAVFATWNALAPLR